MDPNAIPLRDVVENARLDINVRLDRIEKKIDRLDDHAHPEKVSWSALVGTLLTLTGGIVTLVVLLS